MFRGSILPADHELHARFDEYGIVGRSDQMHEVIRVVETVAETKSTVLICGETGTGKEMVAQAIHLRSAQRRVPLVKVNCAAIPDSLLESELFGHVKGAFTDATVSRRGKFMLADGGTIFLDEIGAMALTLQAKLLRVLQEREVEPLGSERAQSVDVRVIAATNRDLKQLIADGRFQEDLYYRLNVIPIDVPPLRDRRDDIPVLAEYFVDKHSTRIGKRIDRIHEQVLMRLVNYDWPGNVRELENAIERAVVLTPGAELTPDTLWLDSPGAKPTSLPSLQLRTNLDWVERETIKAALAHSAGVKKDAAALLGISQRALTYYLAKHTVH